MDLSCTLCVINIIMLYCLGSVQCLSYKRSIHGKWNALITTLSKDLENEYGNNFMPRTVQEANRQGFSRIDGCNQTSLWRGSRYIKKDHAVVLLFDVNGYIAGIQAGIPKNESQDIPTSHLQQYFIENGDYFFLTAYFVKPSIICKKGRMQSEYEEQGTGSDLYFQPGNTPSKSIIFPSTESSLKVSEWVRGNCFSGHTRYWMIPGNDTVCSDYFPVFLMYNKGGKLTGFGWVVAANLTSRRFEHPTPMDFALLKFKGAPKCLANLKHVSTMHVTLVHNLLMSC